MPHGETMTPTFMPVATQASMKGVTNEQLRQIEPTISLILNNTYHLGLRPQSDILDLVGGSHAYQGWDRNLLTVIFQMTRLAQILADTGNGAGSQDSGGFQMVSLFVLPVSWTGKMEWRTDE